MAIERLGLVFTFPNLVDHLVMVRRPRSSSCGRRRRGHVSVLQPRGLRGRGNHGGLGHHDSVVAPVHHFRSSSDAAARCFSCRRRKNEKGSLMIVIDKPLIAPIVLGLSMIYFLFNRTPRKNVLVITARLPSRYVVKCMECPRAFVVVFFVFSHNFTWDDLNSIIIVVIL